MNRERRLQLRKIKHLLLQCVKELKHAAVLLYKSLKKCGRFSLQHKKISIPLVIVLALIGAYVWKWNQKPTLSSEAKKTIESYKNTFPGEVKSGPQFVIEKQNLLGDPESYTIQGQ